MWTIEREREQAWRTIGARYFIHIYIHCSEISCAESENRKTETMLDKRGTHDSDAPTVSSLFGLYVLSVKLVRGTDLLYYTKFFCKSLVRHSLFCAFSKEHCEHFDFFLDKLLLWFHASQCRAELVIDWEKLDTDRYFWYTVKTWLHVKLNVPVVRKIPWDWSIFEYLDTQLIN